MSVARIALFLALVASITGQSFLLIILPPLGRRLGLTDLQTGAILSASALTLIICAPIWGYLSERIGRKPVFLVALGATASAWFLYSFFLSWRGDGLIGAALFLWLFFSIRILHVVLAAGLLPAAQAYMADVTESKDRTGGMGLIAAAYGFGTIAGAALTWAIGGERTVLAFGLVTALLCAAVVTVLLFVPESHQKNASQSVEHQRLQLKRIWPLLVITLLAFAAYSIVQQVIALRLQDALGFSSEAAISMAGASLLITALAMTAVQAGVLHYSPGRPEMLLGLGTLLAALSMVLCAYAQNYSEIFGVFALFGVSLGLVLPANLASLSLRVGARAQGKAAGVNVIGQGLGLTVGPLAGAGLHQISPQTPFLVAASLLILASVLAILAWHSTRAPVDAGTS